VLGGPCVVDLGIPDPAAAGDKLAAAFTREITADHLRLGTSSCGLDTAQADFAAPGPIDKDETMKAMDKAMSTLSGYTAALAAITDASSSDELKKASTSFNNAVGQVADFAQQKGANASDVATAKAASTLGGDVAGLVLAHKQYVALKRTVLAVDPLMPTLAGEVSDALGEVRRARIPVLAQRITRAAVEYNSGADKRSFNDNAALLASIQTQVNCYNALVSANPADLGTNLARAHHALALALQNDKGQVGTLFDDLATLTADANAIQKALAPTP